ncbi:MAG: DEAD/DEAH box helicase, partial [Malacoplasma sp.]|nr:DEAD/DEAH box helicase [Malacoplasma sp.]
MKKINFNNSIKNALQKLGFYKLTDIQKNVIPFVLDSQNLVIVSETGTGKTYAYLLPILEKINFFNNELQAVIILPTRELARQVYSKIIFFKDFINNLKVNLLIGGVD